MSPFARCTVPHCAPYASTLTHTYSRTHWYRWRIEYRVRWQFKFNPFKSACVRLNKRSSIITNVVQSALTFPSFPCLCFESSTKSMKVCVTPNMTIEWCVDENQHKYFPFCDNFMSRMKEIGFCENFYFVSVGPYFECTQKAKYALLRKPKSKQQKNA